MIVMGKVKRDSWESAKKPGEPQLASLKVPLIYSTGADESEVDSFSASLTTAWGQLRQMLTIIALFAKISGRFL
jgi:hypothetical protein